MKQPRKKRKQLPSGLAGAYDDADGSDPRFDPSAAKEAGIHGSGAERRKLMQLCSQVLRILQLAWPSDHPSLDATYPASVTPAPNSHNLLVWIECTVLSEQVDDAAILSAIATKTDFLRQEVARGISRKRTPRLAFAVNRSPIASSPPSQDD
jgi:hypothetical protein